MTENSSTDTPITVFGHTITLAGALGILVVVSLFLVSVAYLMYLNSPASKYDLARPGSQEDASLITSRDEDVDTISKINEAAVKQNLESLQQNISALQNASDFGEQDLSNQNLGLEPSTQPSL